MAWFEKTKIEFKHFLLIGVNVLIWGYAAYTLFSNSKSDELPGLSETFIPKSGSKPADSINYALSLDYPDPFLKEEPKNKLQSTGGNYSEKAEAAKAPVKPAIAKPEPKTFDIKYLGLVQNKTSGTTTGLVSINGISRIIKPGQTIEEINFQEIKQDFIVAKVGREKVTIKR